MQINDRFRRQMLADDCGKRLFDISGGSHITFTSMALIVAWAHL
jgi:hypothetical protein